MKALTRHEKKLTFLLVGAVGLGLHLILFRAALNIDHSNRLQLAQAEEELAEARFWTGQETEWQGRREWLEANFRAVPGEDPGPPLQKFLQGTAKNFGLTIEDQTAPVPKSSSHYLQYATRMRMNGSLGQFLDWLVNVYQPEQGIAVTSLNLKIGPEPPRMVGEVWVGQFFRPNNP